MSCAIYTHTPARTSSTNFQLYYFVIQICSTNWLGHGHGYKWHSSYMCIYIYTYIDRVQPLPYLCRPYPFCPARQRDLLLV